MMESFAKLYVASPTNVSLVMNIPAYVPVTNDAMPTTK